MATFFSSFFFECFLICTRRFTVYLFLPLCREIWRLRFFFHLFSYWRVSSFFTHGLSLAFSHTCTLTHLFFRALGDFSFNASRWPRSLLLSLSGSNLESFRIRNPKELFWGVQGENKHYKRKSVFNSKWTQI